jgi:hypothetical protein
MTQNLSHLAGNKELNGLAKNGSPDTKGALHGLFNGRAGEADADDWPMRWIAGGQPS